MQEHSQELSQAAPHLHARKGERMFAGFAALTLTWPRGSLNARALAAAGGWLADMDSLGTGQLSMPQRALQAPP